MSIEVVPADSKQDREAFLRLPWALYKDFPGWVPNLLMLQRDVINVKKNPFFDHGEAQLFLAKENGRTVGRISAQIDHRHLEYHKEKAGFFGFFECVNDTNTAEALLHTAEGWLRAKGMTVARGPFCFSLDEELGLQIEGFDQQAMIQMPQTQPYYPKLVETAGYTKAQDLLAYKWDIHALPERIREPVARTLATPGLKLRMVNMLHLYQEVDTLLDIYTDAWSDNWGYVPVSKRAARKLADDLRLIADPRVGIIAEMDGVPMGMVVGIPNLYETIRDFNGFVNPINALKLVWRLKIRGPETGRILLFGVKKQFQRRRDLAGLPFALLNKLYENALTRRYKWCEESWILESNGPMNALMPYWDAYVYKRYRIYEKAL